MGGRVTAATHRTTAYPYERDSSPDQYVRIGEVAHGHSHRALYSARDNARGVSRD